MSISCLNPRCAYFSLPRSYVQTVTFKHKIEIMIKSYQNIPKNQAKKKKVTRRKKYRRVRVTKNGGDPLEPELKCEVIRRPRLAVKSLSKGCRRLLDYLRGLHEQYRWIKMSQAAMAKDLGVCRATINRQLLVLEREGFVSNNYHHKQASVYKVTDLLWNKSVAFKLRKLLPVLLFIFGWNVTQDKYYINSRVILKDETRRNTSKIGSLNFQATTRPPASARLDYFHERERMSDEVKEAVQAITEVDLSTRAKCTLALYPAPVIRAAHRMLRDFLLKGAHITKPFGLMLNHCKKECPLVDCSRNNSTLQDLKQKYDFAWSDPDLNSPRIEIPKKAKTSSSRWPAAQRTPLRRSSYEAEEHSDRPRPGDPLTWDQVNAYNRRMNGRDYAPEKSGVVLPAAKHRSKYEEESAQSLDVICDNWEKQWFETEKRLGSNHPVVNKELAASAMVMMIKRNVKIHGNHNYQGIADYLNRVLFEQTAPESIRRGTLLTEKQYFDFLGELFNKSKRAVAEQKSVEL